MIDERLRQRFQMHKLLILINTYDVIKAVRKKFDEKCDSDRHEKLMHRMANKLKTTISMCL